MGTERVVTGVDVKAGVANAGRVEAMEMVIEGTEVAKALGLEVGELAREATGGVMGTQYRSIRTSYYKNNLRENNFGGIASNRAWHMH